MTTFRKSTLKKHTDTLDERFSKLKTTLAGIEPSANIHHLYCDNPDNFATEFCEISELELKLAIHDFEGILKQLKNIKQLKAMKLHSSK